MRSLIEDLEAKRGNVVLVLATRNLELEILPVLYDSLQGCGDIGNVDVVLYCRGGLLNAARRIALLLHEIASHISFIIPHHCESSGTLLALSAHEIIAGPAACFSPIDPHLQADGQQDGSDGPAVISAENIRLFAQMCRDWFGLQEPEAQAHALSALCSNIFPTTLTSFYRGTLETRSVCAELLALSMGNLPEDVRSRISDQLLFGYHSHTFSLTRDDLMALGVPIRRDGKIESIAWEVARELRQALGRRTAEPEGEAWTDTIIATRTTTQRQHQGAGHSRARWETCETE